MTRTINKLIEEAPLFSLDDMTMNPDSFGGNIYHNPETNQYLTLNQPRFENGTLVFSYSTNAPDAKVIVFKGGQVANPSELFAKLRGYELLHQGTPDGLTIDERTARYEARQLNCENTVAQLRADSYQASVERVEEQRKMRQIVQRIRETRI